MAYDPTVWVNNQPPPLSAENLNKLTDEIKAQAATYYITHWLGTAPTWTDGADPALTTAETLNEMERVVQRVAVEAGRSYTPTVWATGWSPARNAARLNKLEQAVAADTSSSLPLQPPVWTGPLVISSGGTYDGQALGVGWQSTSPTQPAVLVQTTEPVIIQNAWIRTTNGARCIEHPWGQNTHLTVKGSRLTGSIVGDPLRSGRAIELEGIRYLLVENCTFEGGSGIRLGPDQSPGTTCIIRYNRQHNTLEEPGRWGNFIQLHPGGTNGNSYLIEWNEIENEYNLSKQEDTISIISVRNVVVRHNMLWHNSIPGNPGQGSNGSITTEDAGSGVVCDNITVHDNQIVDTATGVFFAATNNSIAYNNRLIQDGYLPDGVTRIASGWGGYALLTGCVNSHFHNNISGYVNRAGVRNDYDDLSGAPEGHAAESANNTLLPNPITRQMELDEWTAWQGKLSANNITIGA